MSCLLLSLAVLSGARPAHADPGAETQLFGHARAGLSGFVSDSSADLPRVRVQPVAVGLRAGEGDRADALVRLSLPVDAAGGWGEGGDLVDELRLRLFLSDDVSVQIGKIYSPYGYWNAAMPHGDFAALGAERPAVLRPEREGAALATRQAGLNVHGQHFLSTWTLGYDLGLGGGRGPQLDRSATDTDPTPAAWLRLSLQAPVGVQVGLTGAVDPMRPEGGTPGADSQLQQDIDEGLLAVHVALLRPHTEILAEVFVITHAAPGGDDLEFSRSGYLQVGHRLGRTTPYLRADYLELWALDPIYQLLPDPRSELTLTAGARTLLTERLALLVEAYGQRRVPYGDSAGPTVTRPGGGLTLAAAF